MNINKKKFFTIILVALLAMTFISAFPQVSAKYKTGKTAYVSYKGKRSTSAGTKYYYKVYSGSGSQKIKYWYLKSTAFKYYDVVQVSERVRQYGTTLKFTRSYRNNEKRCVSFTLGKEYRNPRLGCIKYGIKTKYTKTGWIKGPVMPKF